jgi:hypothetical protein
MSTKRTPKRRQSPKLQAALGSQLSAIDCLQHILKLALSDDEIDRRAARAFAKMIGIE